MKLKNTENKKSIIIKNDSHKKALYLGVIAFSLAFASTISIAARSSESTSEKIGNGDILDSQEYGYYSVKYIENLHSINPEQFDQNFCQIYNNVSYSYNNNEYDGSSIYIVQYDDGSTHLINVDNNKVDFLTGTPINGHKMNMSLWKDSSNFYMLYKNGVISDSNVVLSENYSNYISNWDGDKHYETVKLLAEKNAKEECQKKFGGK